ncbi:hypothetical protein Tco_0581974 [Tanacetum coccineum]
MKKSNFHYFITSVARLPTNQSEVAEAVTMACYTQNRSLIRKRHNKTPYKLLHDQKPDISYLHVFGALYYPTNDSKDLGHVPKLLTPGTISSGLVQNIPSSTPYVLPTKNDWEILFQPNFDEYFNPLPCVDLQVPVVIAPKPTISTEVSHDIEVTHMDNNPYVDFSILEPISKESSSQVVIPNHVHSINQPPKRINEWTKDHLIDNVIGDPSRPVSSRINYKMMPYYFDAFLSSG